jgi:Putative transposase
VSKAFDAVAQVQANFRRRILRAFVGRGLLESFESKEMLAYKHSGFLVDAAVCIEARDRAALEPPPRTHWHRYFGVLAPNSPLRAAVTALATPIQAAAVGQSSPAVAALPRILSARGPPLWDDYGAQVGEGSQISSDWDLAVQVAGEFEVDRRPSW